MQSSDASFIARVSLLLAVGSCCTQLRADDLPEPAGQKVVVADSTDVADDALQAVFRKPLAAEEQLILLNIQQPGGQTTLLFLGRVRPGGGFESIGALSTSALRAGLREHWQKVLRNRLAGELQRLDAKQRDKVQVAMDLTVTRIVRDFDLLCGLKDLGVERSKYQPLEDKLSRIGREGPWNIDPLIVGVIKQIQSIE